MLRPSISWKLQRLMRAAEEKGYYLPRTQQQFQDCRKLASLGVFEEYDPQPGSYSLTGGGKAMLGRLEERAQ